MTDSATNSNVPRGTFLFFKLLFTLCAGVLLCVLVINHTPGMTGPEFWQWAWRRLDAWPLYGLMAAALVPLLVGQALYRPNSRWRTLLALLLAMGTCYGMKLASISVHTRPPSLLLVADIVEHPDTTSYYTDAAALNSIMPVRQWLGDFPKLMRTLSLHSQTKPPGPILYYTAFIKAQGVGDHAAMTSGLVLGALATLSILAAYLVLRILTRDPVAAMCGAALLAPAPGFVLFFPMFDPTYIVLSSALIGLWALAVERLDWRPAILLGAVLAITSMITFNILVIGFFMAMYPLVVPEERTRQTVLTTLRLAAIAFGTAVVLLILLRLLVGYDALATFISAWRNQHALLERHAADRPYPQTIPFDLTDFALGASWVAVALVILFFATQPEAHRNTRLLRLGVLCIAQPIVVAVTGLLQMETARVWNFMLPLLLLPAALELRTWPAPARVAVYVMVGLTTAAITQNIGFVY